MARKPRIHIPGEFYHVMLRGNAIQDICYNHSKTKSNRVNFMIRNISTMSSAIRGLSDIVKQDKKLKKLVEEMIDEIRCK